MITVDIMVGIDSLSEPPGNLWVGSYVQNTSNADQLVSVVSVCCFQMAEISLQNL